MKPSKQNAAGFKELGINVADFKKGTLTLPEILNKIKTNTQGWTKEQRAAAIATAFGTEAQAGMNALVSEGGDALTDLTNKTEKATGSTKKIADTMNSTKAAQLAQFKESLHVLAITIGDQLTPTLMPLVKDATQVVKAFGNLNKSTQQTIVKTAAFAAAIGPLLSILGGATRGLGALSGAFVAPLLGMSRMFGASKQGATGLGILKAGFSKTAYESGNFATKVGTTATSVAATSEKVAGSANTFTIFGSKVKTAGSAVLTFAAANPVATGVILATTAALVAGGVWWESYGKKAYDSQQRINRWGSDVGASADKSLSKMQGFNQKSSAALDDFSSNVTKNASSIGKSFKGMSNTIGDSADKANKKLKDGLKNLPDDVANVVKSAAAKQESANNKIKSNAKQTADNVNNIVKNAANEHRRLTDDENQYILNSRKKMNNNEVQLIGLSGKKKIQVEKALNSSMRSMSANEAVENYDLLSESIKKQNGVYKKSQSQLKALRKGGFLSEKAYNVAMSKLSKEHANDIMNEGKKMIEYGKKAHLAQGGVSDDLKRIGLSYDEVAKHTDKSAQSMSTANSRIADTASKMGTVARKAGEDWNSMVLNPKTGRIKTNAQQTLNDTAKTKQGWAQLKFDLKNAKISSNAKSMIGEAAVQSGRWDSLPWKEKKLMLRVNQKGKQDLVAAVKGIKNWNQLTPAQKNAIIHAKGQKELALAMIDAGEWNNLPMKDKEALVKTSGEKDMIDLLTKTGAWNKLSVSAKQAVIEGKGSGELVDQLNNLGQWNKLTMQQKSLVINNKATAPIVDAMIKSGAWNKLSLTQKNAIIHDQATAKIVLAMQKSGMWNQLSLKEQNAVVHDKATAQLVQALTSSNKWQGLDIPAKNAIVNDKASAPIIAALVQSGQWNVLPLSEKNAIIHTGNSAMDLANLVVAYGNFNALSDAQKTLIINNQSAMTALQQAGYGIQSYNLTPTQLKQLKGDNADILNKTSNGKLAVVSFNGQSVAVKKLKGDNVDVLGKISTSKASIDSHNSKPVDTKHFKGNSSDVVNKSNISKNSVGTFNNKSVSTKHFKGRDQASGPAHNATNAIGGFQNKPNTITKTLRTVIETVKKTFHLENGTSDFNSSEVAMVNDQRGSIFRELIHLPTGESFVPTGRNILMALPRHSQVVPANQTNRLLGGIKQYANGTPGYSSVVKDFTELSPSLTNQTTQYFNSSNPVNNSPVNNHNEYTINIQAAVSSGTDIRKLADKVMREIKRKDDRNILAQGGGVNY